MSVKTYAERLRDPRWQKKRLEKLQAGEWTCEVCYATGNSLHVHHKHYIQGRNPWEYDDDQLAVLCDGCHTARHAEDNKLHDLLSRVAVDGMPGGVDDLYWLIAGFLDSEQKPEVKAHRALYEIGAAAMWGCWNGFEGSQS